MQETLQILRYRLFTNLSITNNQFFLGKTKCPLTLTETSPLQQIQYYHRGN